MTVVQPNGISGLTSITSNADTISFYASNYSSLAIFNTNISASSGVSTVASLDVGTAATIFSNGNITAGIVTASAADLQTGPLNVGTAATISANGNATFAGIVTATSFATGGGNINLGDSSGATDDRIVLGDGADLSIYHDPTHGHSFIKESGSGGLIIGASVFEVYNPAISEKIISATADGAVEIYYDNVKELSTKLGGVKLWGHSEEVFNALGNSSGNVTIDFTTANLISCTLTNTTVFKNPTTESVGQSGSIVITQDGTGSRTASWESNFKWVGGTAPTLSTTAAAVDRVDYLVVAADTIHCVISLDVK